jgi:hypothetical protein
MRYLYAFGWQVGLRSWHCPDESENKIEED